MRDRKEILDVAWDTNSLLYGLTEVLLDIRELLQKKKKKSDTEKKIKEAMG